MHNSVGMYITLIQLNTLTLCLLFATFCLILHSFYENVIMISLSDSATAVLLELSYINKA